MTDPFYQTNQWRNLRHRVVARDRYRCTCCGASVRGKGLSRVDHVIPRRQRPDLALSSSNLRTLCASCDNKRHSEKGGHHVEREPVNAQGLPASWR